MTQHATEHAAVAVCWLQAHSTRDHLAGVVGQKKAEVARVADAYAAAASDIKAVRALCASKYFGCQKHTPVPMVCCVAGCLRAVGGCCSM